MQSWKVLGKDFGWWCQVRHSISFKFCVARTDQSFGGLAHGTFKLTFKSRFFVSVFLEGNVYVYEYWFCDAIQKSCF